MKRRTLNQILFVSLSNIGDAILSMPVLDELHKAYPEAKIDLVVGDRAQIVFAGDERIRETFVTSRPEAWLKRWQLFRKLYERRYDAVIDLRQSYFSLLDWGNWFAARGQHMRDRHLSKLRRLGITKHGYAASAASQPTPKPLVLMAPGARSHIKMWPRRRYAELAERLIQTRQAQVVWVGDDAERDLCMRIQKSVNAETQIQTGLTWREFRALVKRASLFVTNDSSPLHLADEMNIPTLAFFGPTNERKYGSQRTPVGVLRNHTFCAPCENASCPTQMECLNSISVDQALKRATRLLEGRGRYEDHILLVRLDRLGDALLSLPAIEAIKRQQPDTEVTVLTRPQTSLIYERSSSVDRVLTYDYASRGQHRSPMGYWHLLKELRRYKFSAVLILHPSLRSHILAFLCQIPKRYGIRAAWPALLTRSVADQRHEGQQHESDNVCDVVDLWQKIPRVKNYRFQVFAQDEIQAEQLLEAADWPREQMLAVLHPGSSSPSKRWPVQAFAQLAERLHQQGLATVIVGEKSHVEMCQQLRNLIRTPCLNLAGRTDLVDLAGVIKRAQVFVSNDSGPVHLAVGVGTSVVSIFGRVQPGLSAKRWRPLSERALVAQKFVGCQTCLADACSIDFECLKQLSVDHVAHAVDSLLSQAAAV